MRSRCCWAGPAPSMPHHFFFFFVLDVNSWTQPCRLLISPPFSSCSLARTSPSLNVNKLVHSWVLLASLCPSDFFQPTSRWIPPNGDIALANQIDWLKPFWFFYFFFDFYDYYLGSSARKSEEDLRCKMGIYQGHSNGCKWRGDGRKNPSIQSIISSATARSCCFPNRRIAVKRVRHQ